MNSSADQNLFIALVCGGAGGYLLSRPAVARHLQISRLVREPLDEESSAFQPAL
jgi:hypothetical protein